MNAYFLSIAGRHALVTAHTTEIARVLCANRDRDSEPEIWFSESVRIHELDPAPGHPSRVHFMIALNE